MSKKSIMVLVLVVLLIPISLWAAGLGQAADSNDSAIKNSIKSSITVSGEGRIFVPSDEAVLSIAVRTIKNTASAAMNENSKTMTKVIGALKAEGLTSDEIKTGNVSLYPQQEWKENRAPKIISYTAENRVIIKTKKLNKLGGIIDAGISAGANEASDLRFQLSEDSLARLDAIKKAVKNARAKAEVLAKEVGAGLGKAIIVSEGSQAMPVPVYLETMKAAPNMDGRGAAPPIMPQDVEVHAMVSISYEMH